MGETPSKLTQKVPIWERKGITKEEYEISKAQQLKRIIKILSERAKLVETLGDGKIIKKEAVAQNYTKPEESMTGPQRAEVSFEKSVSVAAKLLGGIRSGIAIEKINQKESDKKS